MVGVGGGGKETRRATYASGISVSIDGGGGAVGGKRRDALLRYEFLQAISNLLHFLGQICTKVVTWML